MPDSAKDSSVRPGQLDELFHLAGRYRDGIEYKSLLEFVVRFRAYAPFNCMLMHIQMSGAHFVAPASRWMQEWKRPIKPGQRPLVILQPMGPVMFVFDVSQTETAADSIPLPEEIVAPFTAVGNDPTRPLLYMVENAKSDGVRTRQTKTGSQAAASIRTVTSVVTQRIRVRMRPHEEWIEAPTVYDVLYSDSLNVQACYAAIVHELAHLYLGHLGSPNTKWWPARTGLTPQEEEFEAESVAWIVCRRFGVAPRSERYLAGYLGANRKVPSVNLDLILKVAGDIEGMGKQITPLRRKRAK